jgi:hypothetical protein
MPINTAVIAGLQIIISTLRKIVIASSYVKYVKPAGIKKPAMGGLG